MEDIYFHLHYEDIDVINTLDGLKGYNYRWPSLNWVYGTYYRLKQKGVRGIHLVSSLPQKGIVVMPSHQAKLMQVYSKDLFIISTLADSPPRFYTHLNVSQNPYQSSLYPNLLGFPIWKHIPHWPQPGIVPRQTERGARFDTIGFFGDRTGIPAELLGEEFARELAALGMRLKVDDATFNDYSDVDAVVAVREFSDEPFFYKPASKLVNGWLAGVPVIGGADSAFSALRRSPLDYLLVKSKAELLAALQTLKASPELRRQMVQNGRQRVQALSEEAILHQWEELLFNEAQTHYRTWLKKNAVERGAFFADLFLSRGFRSVKNRIFSNRS